MPSAVRSVLIGLSLIFLVVGPYRYVRNPMYSGILIVGTGFGLAVGTWLLPLAAALMFWILARRTRIEEMYLVARFGDQYRSYMTRVGRFFPRLNQDRMTPG